MNYETTAIYHVVAGNYGEGDYRYWRERAEDAVQDVGCDEAVQVIADELQEFHDNNVPEDLPEPFLSILRGGLSEVNWREVAEVAVEEFCDD